MASEEIDRYTMVPGNGSQPRNPSMVQKDEIRNLWSATCALLSPTMILELVESWHNGANLACLEQRLKVAME